MNMKLFLMLLTVLVCSCATQKKLSLYEIKSTVEFCKSKGLRPHLRSLKGVGIVKVTCQMSERRFEIMEEITEMKRRESEQRRESK